VWIAIFTEDANALHEQYKKTPAVTGLEATNMPRGTRQINVEHPNGHRSGWAVIPPDVDEED
jgi:hypothetical protein